MERILWEEETVRRKIQDSRFKMFLLSYAQTILGSSNSANKGSYEGSYERKKKLLGKERGTLEGT